MSRRIALVSLCLVAALATGCAQKPDDEIKKFENDYPNQYQELLEPELKNQDHKFAIFRSYSRTYEIMDSVRQGKDVPAKRETGINGITSSYMGNGVTCYTVSGYQAVGISCVKQ